MTTLIPDFAYIAPNIGPSSCVFDISINTTSVAVYILTMPSKYIGGIYEVDMNGVDSSGNPLNLTGNFDANGRNLPNIQFVVDTSYSPRSYPGEEFTIIFNGTGGQQFLTIGLRDNGPALPYIFSNPFNNTTSLANSVTFKTSGGSINVISSGPSGWVDYVALYAYLQQLPPF